MKKYILALAAVIAAVHCKAGSAIQADARAEQYCGAFCSCEGCTDADREVCVSDMGDLISEAQTSRCDNELDSYFTCLGKDAFCDSGTYDTSTCRTEESAVTACINGTSGAGGASSSSTTSSATGVGGGGGGGACIPCSSLISGASPAALCPASQSFFSDLLTCGCGVCGSQCPSLCAGQADTSTCFMCLQSVCTPQYTTCQNDL